MEKISDKQFSDKKFWTFFYQISDECITSKMSLILKIYKTLLCKLNVFKRKNQESQFLQSCFLPGIFFRGGKIYCCASFFCYANFSIVFGPNFGGSLRGGQTVWGHPPSPMDES